MTKKFIFVAVMFLFACSSSFASYYDEGHSGSSSDPFIIDSVSDMTDLRDRVNSGTEEDNMYYRLTSDLKITNNEWYPGNNGNGYEPIGLNEEPFTGHFDGNGHKITMENISVYYAYREGNGLLQSGRASLFGVVKTNIGYAVKNLTVDGSIQGDSAAGVVLDLYNASIEDCSFTGKLTSYSVYGTGTVTHDITEGSDPNGYAGGIVGTMYSGTIKNCTVKNAEIITRSYSGHTGYAGGIVMRMAGGTIEGCTIDSKTSIICNPHTNTNYTAETGDSSLGGVAGVLNKITNYANSGNISNNVSYANLSSRAAYGTQRIGGIIGQIIDSNITLSNNSYSKANYGIGSNAGGSASDQGCINLDKNSNDNTGNDNTDNNNTNNNNTNTGNNNQTNNNNNNNRNVGSSGGGGCNSGLTLVAFIVLAAFTKRRA